MTSVSDDDVDEIDAIVQVVNSLGEDDGKTTPTEQP